MTTLAKAEGGRKLPKDPEAPDTSTSFAAEAAGSTAAGAAAVGGGYGLAHAGRRQTRTRRPHLFDGHTPEPSRPAAPKPGGTGFLRTRTKLDPRAPAPLAPKPRSERFGPPEAVHATFGRTKIVSHALGELPQAVRAGTTRIGVRNAAKLGMFNLRNRKSPVLALLHSLHKADGATPMRKGAARKRDAADVWLRSSAPSELTNNLTRAKAFDEAKHPRGEHGKFSAGTGGDQQPLPHAGNVVPLDQKRTLATMPSFYRAASRTKGMPVDYTGSRSKEMPVGSFKVAELKLHKRPKGVGLEDHHALRKRLFRTVVALQEPTITRALTLQGTKGRRGAPLVPEGTSKQTLVRAYNHGAMLALHGYGIGTYNFRMDDALKEEMTPMVPMIRYAQRRVQATMLATEKGAWRPYRAENGVPFQDKRRDKVTGEIRLRVPPNQQLVKAYDPSKHPREHDGKFSRKTGEMIGRAAGVAAGGVAGQHLGHKHGATVGGKAGALASRAHAAVRDRVAPPAAGQGWKRALSNEAREMKVRDLGRHLGGRYGRAIGGVAAGLAGYYAGGKAGSAIDHAGRRRRAKKAGRLEQFERLNTLGKRAEDGHPLAKAFPRQRPPAVPSGALSLRDPAPPPVHPVAAPRAAPATPRAPRSSSGDQIAQPAQLVGGALGGALATGAAARVSQAPINRAATMIGRRKAAGFRLKAAQSGALQHGGMVAEGVVRSQAKLLQHLHTHSARAAIGGAVGLTAGLAGDYIGDWGARRATGAKGKDDEYRHSSLLGTAVGAVGAVAGHKIGGSKFWRSQRYRGTRRGIMGLAAGVLGSAAAEAAGNLMDEKTGATEAVVAGNRKFAQRFRHA